MINLLSAEWVNSFVPFLRCYTSHMSELDDKNRYFNRSWLINSTQSINATRILLFDQKDFLITEQANSIFPLSINQIKLNNFCGIAFNWVHKSDAQIEPKPKK